MKGSLKLSLRFYYLPSFRLTVLWSPKCACSSLVHWLRHLVATTKESVPSTKEMDPRVYLNKAGYDYSQLVNAVPLSTIPESRLVSLTRHPISRMRSSYINKFLRYGKKNLTSSSDLEGFAKRFILKVSSDKLIRKKIPNSQLCADNDNFTLSMGAFLKIVGGRLFDKRIYDHHFMPQICNSDEYNLLKKITHNSSASYVIKTESFNIDLATVNDCLGINFIPSKSNETTFDDDWVASDDLSVLEMTNQDMIEQKILPSKNAVYAYCVKNECMEAFGNDFQHFNYPPKP